VQQSAAARGGGASVTEDVEWNVRAPTRHEGSAVWPASWASLQRERFAKQSEVFCVSEALRFRFWGRSERREVPEVNPSSLLRFETLVCSQRRLPCAC